MQELNVGAVREILSLKTSGMGRMPKEERRVANGERQGLHTCLTIIVTPRQALTGGGGTENENSFVNQRSVCTGAV